ncbi:MAG: hypothetical protein ACRENE_27260 [Polyangiaceae bacterium]
MISSYVVGGDSETWDSVADRLGIPREALLRANYRDPDHDWPDPAQGDELILPPQPDDASIAPENDHALDCGGEDSPSFDVPPQKESMPAEPDSDRVWAGSDDNEASDQPILVAANDDDLVRSLINTARNSDEKRDKDDSVTRPGGRFIPVARVTSASRPLVPLDHGFLDDGKGNLDPSKMRAATASDYAALGKWEVILKGAQVARPDLEDATGFYSHFLDATGSPMEFSYDKYAARDGAGGLALTSAIEDVRAGAIELNERAGMTEGTFVIQTKAIPVGASVKTVSGTWRPENNRYPYPGTENWQKTIGAHAIWLVGIVAVDTHTTSNRRMFSIEFTLHAEDRYNFNPGSADIASGALDAENGRFEVTGLGKEFDSYSTLTRTLTFSLSLAPTPDFRARPADFMVIDPRASTTPGDPSEQDLDGGLPPGGV